MVSRDGDATSDGNAIAYQIQQEDREKEWEWKRWLSHVLERE